MAAKERGFLTKITPELDRLLAVGFFMDQELYDRAIGQAGERLRTVGADERHCGQGIGSRGLPPDRRFPSCTDPEAALPQLPDGA